MTTGTVGAFQCLTEALKRPIANVIITGFKNRQRLLTIDVAPKLDVPGD